MASKRAQKSEVHQTTDDASRSSASDAKSPPRKKSKSPGAASARHGTQREEIGGGPGAADASSGGGAGAGIPGGGTDMRMGEQLPEGDVDQDRRRLFPEQSPQDRPGQRDDSDFGGPLRLETDDEGNLR